MFFSITEFFNRNRWRYRWRYRRGHIPWDTADTPFEVMDFISATPPGKALDLGCGTGNHALTLARNGWDVTGIDFVPDAIRSARRKAAESGLKIDFIDASVTRPGRLEGPFDYALDIGCLFGLNTDERSRYADILARLLRPGAWYMLYAWLPRLVNGQRSGLSADDVDSLFQKNFSKSRVVYGEEKGIGSAWYWYRRR